MNRRAFMGFLGQLIAVGSAMSVAPAVLQPLKNVVIAEATKVLTAEEWLALIQSKPNYALAA